MPSNEKTNDRNKGGRPRADTEALTLRIPRDLIAVVDAFRRTQPDLPTRPEAIRRIVKDWLEVNGYKEL